MCPRTLFWCVSSLARNNKSWYVSGWHWNQWSDWICSVQHYIGDRSLCSGGWYCSLSQLVLSGQRLYMLFDLYYSASDHNLQQYCIMVSVYARGVNTHFFFEVTYLKIRVTSNISLNQSKARILTHSQSSAIFPITYQKKKLVVCETRLYFYNVTACVYEVNIWTTSNVTSHKNQIQPLFPIT